MPGRVVKSADGRKKILPDKFTSPPPGWTFEDEPQAAAAAAASEPASEPEGPSYKSQMTEQAAASKATSDGIMNADENALRGHRAKTANTPWFNIPGVEGGTQAPEDTGFWDGVKQVVKGFARDPVLVPSQGSVWQEPSEEEAKKALKNENATPVQIEEYREAEWGKALQVAQKDVKTLYRGSRINGSSPSFMRIAKQLSDTLGKGEAFVRGYDRAFTGGVVSSALDAETGPLSPFLMPAEEQEKAKARERENIKRGERMTTAKSTEARAPGSSAEVSSDNSRFAAAGTLAGSISPRGLAGQATTVAEGALKAGKNALGGPIENVLRQGAATGLGTFATELFADEVDQAQRGSVGMETKGQGEMVLDAGKTAAVATVLGAGLGVPQAASRAIRTSRDGHAAAMNMLDEYGGRTRFWSEVEAPGSSADLTEAAMTKSKAGQDEARERAIGHLFPELSAIKRKATAEVDVAAGAGESGYGLGSQLFSEAADSARGMRKVAGEAIERGKQVDEAAMKRARTFTDKLRKRIDERMGQQATATQLDTKAALIAEGDKATSLRPVIEKHQQIVDSLSFADGDLMPNTTVARFKSAIDGLTEKRIVGWEDLPYYAEGGFGYKQLPVQGDEPVMYEVLLPKNVTAGELDNYIKATNELANWQGGSGGIDAARFKDIAAAATELRGEAFKILSGVKERAHVQMSATERMLEASGLGRTFRPGVGADTVGNEAAMIDNLNELRSPRLDSSSAVKHEELSKWLSAESPEMFKEYVELRKLQDQQAGFGAFGIKAGMDGKAHGETMDSLLKFMSGDSDKFAASSDALGMSIEDKLVRQEAKRVEGIFEVFGTKIPNEVGDVQRAGLRSKLVETLSSADNTNFNLMMNRLKPEQRSVARTARRAAMDAEKSFETIGLGGRKWSQADQLTIKEAMSTAFESYRTKGSLADRDVMITGLMERYPKFGEAMRTFRGEKVYQELRYAQKTGMPTVYSKTAWDMVNHRLDALMGKGQKGTVGGVRTPFGAPAEYSMALSQPTAPDSEPGESPSYLSGRKGFDFLVQLVEAASKVGGSE